MPAFRQRLEALRDALLPKKTAALTEDFTKLMPHIPMRSEFAWCGTFGTTRDGLPYIDRHPRDRNSWFALGMGGNGITFSTIAAEEHLPRKFLELILLELKNAGFLDSKKGKGGARAVHG